jgi:hypothetical protein
VDILTIVAVREVDAEDIVDSRPGSRSSWHLVW